jgi:hypothetical protein
VTNRIVNILVEYFIPCAWMLGVVHYMVYKTIMLSTFVFPLVWAWKEVDLVSLVSIMDQKILRNHFSPSETMVFGNTNMLKEELNNGRSSETLFFRCKNYHLG